ncbi:DUF4435 domain-containing protein [Paraburkholderia dipogonis]|uniref:DUF4435 domain-containing protein n=1 Tax=Paraburkholderia dipogonis TaxID=1211383 RepID=A0ABW9B7P5_9BURK
MFEDIPKYSDEALSAVDMFLFEFNDILVYVEDEGQENLYLKILERIVPGVRVENIFPLNGKENVLSHCDRNKISRRPAFYMLDKDYDDLLKKTKNDKRLIYLRKYSIENYFIDESAAIELIVSEQPKISRNEVENNIRIDRFMERTLTKIRPLVRTFFLMQLHDAGGKGCGLPIEQFTSGKPFLLDDAKISEFEKLLFDVLKERKIYDRLEGMQAAGDQHIAFDLASVAQHACGKHLLSLMKHWLSHAWGVRNISADSFCYRLASACNFNSLNYIADHIRATLPVAKAA